ncbi:MAG: hypothetical protein D6785_11430 [Planctomycetota bacterium]|nr:MAG: hypothetical protein D6785_11430 [Planctomycetota bacterium]
METKLVVQKRDLTGKESARKIRKKGQIPGVIYGLKKEVVHIQVEDIAFRKVFRQKPETIELEWEGNIEKVKIQDIQIDTLEEKILHVDFLRLS